MHPSLIALWPQSAIIMLVLLIVGPILLWLLYRWISRRLDFAQKKPKLSVIMAVFFVCLSLPILIFILAYNDYRHSEVMMATLKDDVDKTRQASIENVENMIKGVTGTLPLLAGGVAADPAFFRPDSSTE